MKDAITNSVYTDEEHIKSRRITTGAFVHADAVTVHEVSAGAIVIAKEVYEIEEIKAGGVVVTPEIHSRDFEESLTGYRYNTVDQLINHLKQKLNNEAFESDGDSLREKSIREKIKLAEQCQ